MGRICAGDWLQLTSSESEQRPPESLSSNTPFSRSIASLFFITSADHFFFLAACAPTIYDLPPAASATIDLRCHHWGTLFAVGESDIEAYRRRRTKKFKINECS